MTFEEVFGPFSWQIFVQVMVRMGFAVLLGGIIGYEREATGKPAGIRTHILVCLGTAFFIFPSNIIAMSGDGLSRIIQGIGAGIGFLGAGTIIKDAQGEMVRGLTSAATIWATAAIGIAIGLGQIWIAIMGVTVVWFVLRILGIIEKRTLRRERQNK
jgi:putative Mg2+ transporter-C (MgtC) family protein